MPSLPPMLTECQWLKIYLSIDLVADSIQHPPIFTKNNNNSQCQTQAWLKFWPQMQFGVSVGVFGFGFGLALTCVMTTATTEPDDDE